MDGREKVLEDGRHELELLVLAAEAGQDELRAQSDARISESVRGAIPERDLARTKGASANSRPTLLGRRAIRKTSLAKLYRNTLKLSVGPLGSLINLRLTVVVPSINERSARSAAVSFVSEEEVEGTGRGASVAGGWEKTIRCVTPRGPDMETKSRRRLDFRSCEKRECQSS